MSNKRFIIQGPTLSFPQNSDLPRFLIFRTVTGMRWVQLSCDICTLRSIFKKVSCKCSNLKSFQLWLHSHSVPQSNYSEKLSWKYSVLGAFKTILLGTYFHGTIFHATMSGCLHEHVQDQRYDCNFYIPNVNIPS